MSESYYLKRELPPDIAKPRLPRVECSSERCKESHRRIGECTVRAYSPTPCFCQCHLPRKATK